MWKNYEARVCTNKNTPLEYNTTNMGQAEGQNTKSLNKKPQYLDAILSVIFLKRALMVSQKPADPDMWKRKLKLWNSNCVYGPPYNALRLLIYKLSMYR